MESSITIVENGLKPEFVVTYDNGKKACVQGLTVTAVEDGKREDVWALRQSDKGGCADRLAYGTAPAGYETVVTARPLSPQRSYEVYASGPGWGTTKPLTVR